MEDESLYGKPEPMRLKFNAKTVSFFVIGVLTLFYCVIEIVVAIALNSLTLLSDGFHNFSDVIALGIAFFAAQKANAYKTDRMTFGWARTEIIGGLVNGCFLLSLSVYIVLEAIPRLIPSIVLADSDCASNIEGQDDYYIGVAAAGLLINTIGTLTFHFTGQGHMHSHAGGGHDHSHGGHGGHGGHDDDEEEDHGHSHAHGAHSHGGDDHGHSHAKKKTPEDHGHSHSGGHGHSHDGGHAHSHGEKTPNEEDEEEEGHGHSHSGGHGHSHAHGGASADHEEGEEGHGHSHSGGHGHSHSHGGSPDEVEVVEDVEVGHGHSHSGGHGHSHSSKKDKKARKEEEVSLLKSDYQLTPDPYNAYSLNGEEPIAVEFPEKKKKKAKDMNVHAVFLHYLGDMLSSFFVLVAGLLMKFIKQGWTIYLDPIFSILIVGIILVTTYPLVKNCCMILLQFVPRHINLARVNREIENVPGVKGAHDLHIWQLVDGMDIGTVHVILDYSANVSTVFAQIKNVFHRYGVHSSVIQPEFSDLVKSKECLENCVESCEENWCCKKESEKERKTGGSYSV